MVTLFAVLYMLSDEPREHSLELSLATFETREACERYWGSDEFVERWKIIEKKMPKYHIRLGCENIDD
jgi:hypothetical protein